MKKKVITRRDFLRAAAGTAMAATLSPGIAREIRQNPRPRGPCFGCATQPYPGGG